MEQMVAAGQGRRNRLAATAGGQRASGEGCFIWAHATHIHTPSVKPSSLLIPPLPNTQCAAMPPQKQKDAPRKTFHLQMKLAEAGQKKTGQLSFVSSVSSRVHTRTHTDICVCVHLCVMSCHYVCDLRGTEKQGDDKKSEMWRK